MPQILARLYLQTPLQHQVCINKDLDEVPTCGAEAAKSVDDYDNDYLSEEEETMQLGGEGFSAEQLAEAEKRFQEKIVGFQLTAVCIVGYLMFSAKRLRLSFSSALPG